jgi:uncharacterized protein YbcI
MASLVDFQSKNKSSSSQHYQHDYYLNEGKFTNKQRRQFQHEIKIHMERYAKDLIGKGSDFTKVTVWEDMLILRCKGFLTEPEKFITTSSKGSNLVKASRLQIARQFAIDNVPFFEAMLGANCIHQTFDVESDKDFWIHVMVFDQLLIEIN